MSQETPAGEIRGQHGGLVCSCHPAGPVWGTVTAPDGQPADRRPLGPRNHCGSRHAGHLMTMRGLRSPGVGVCLPGVTPRLGWRPLRVQQGRTALTPGGACFVYFHLCTRCFCCKSSNKGMLPISFSDTQRPISGNPASQVTSAKLKYLFLAHRKRPDQAHRWTMAGRKELTQPLWRATRSRNRLTPLPLLLV